MIEKAIRKEFLTPPRKLTKKQIEEQAEAEVARVARWRAHDWDTPLVDDDLLIHVSEQTWCDYDENREENRRFLPILIVCFDTEALTRDRDQLWAEAAHYEALGEPITLDRSLWDAAATIQAQREIENPFLDTLRVALGEAEGWVTIIKLWKILGIELDQRQRNSRMVGKAMRKLSFARMRVKDRTGQSPKGKRDSIYYQRGKDEPHPMQTLDPEYEQARKEAAAAEERRKLQETANEALRKTPLMGHVGGARCFRAPQAWQ